MPKTFLHHNRGVPSLAYTLRIDREIRYVALKPFNKVLVGDETKFIVTKGICEAARKFSRIKLVPYTGNWPRCALIWQVIKEVIND